MITLQRLDACPHCGSAAFTPDVPCEDRLYGLVDGLAYARCQGCEVLFLSTRVAESELGQLYPPTYHPYLPVASTGRGSRLARLSAQAVLAVVHRLFPDPLSPMMRTAYTPPHPGATFVDFGCGSPAQLVRAADLGWSAVGVDFTPVVVETVRAAGFPAHLVDDAWQAIGPGSVHLLRMNHVLEHLYRPWDVLSRILDLLAPGGRLHVAVPNPAGVSAHLFGRDWQSYDVRHTLLYSPYQAKEFFEKLGLREVRIVHETLSKDMARSWGYRRARLGRMARKDVESLAFRLSLQVLLVLPAKAAAIAGRADRFHLFATK